MAYQNVGTPRFYVNCIEWMHSLGQVSGAGSLGINKYFTTSASNPTYNGLGDGYNDTKTLPEFGYKPYSAIMQTKSFIALLGHNLKSADCEMLFSEGAPSYTPFGNLSDGKEVNCGSASYIRPDYNGFSLTTGSIIDWEQTASSSQPGSIRFESGVWGQADDYPYGELGGVSFCRSKDIGNNITAVNCRSAISARKLYPVPRL